MSRTPSADDRNLRVQELLADRALFGLNADEARELAALGADRTDRQDADEIDDLELAAAAADLGLHERGGDEQLLPPRIREKILNATRGAAAGPAADHASARSAAPVAGPARAMLAPPREASRREWFGWFAAAAATVAAVWFAKRPLGWRPEEDFSPAELRDELLALRNRKSDDVLLIDWTRGPDQSGVAAEARGDVVWSPARQQGVMRFSGLAPNDSAREQYQLWVFDAERGDDYPVDGGVFDVPAGTDDVLVPIRTRLPIRNIKMFAITVEPPGGVVVSDRSRLPLLATAEKAQ